jgi:hypothetical protein
LSAFGRQFATPPVASGDLKKRLPRGKASPAESAGGEMLRNPHCGRTQGVPIQTNGGGLIHPNRRLPYNNVLLDKHYRLNQISRLFAHQCKSVFYLFKAVKLMSYQLCGIHSIFNDA